MSHPENGTAPQARGAGTEHQADPAPTGYAHLRHESHLRLLSSRIAWLARHHHWWLRTPEGAAQLEYIERRDAA